MEIRTWTLAWMGVGLVTFFVLLKIRAPYGRYQGSRWGPSVSNRFGWVMMELPSLLVISYYLLASDIAKPSGFILMGMFGLHYLHRSLIFPFAINTAGKRMPLLIVGSAIVFNLINANLQGHFLSRQSDFDPWFMTAGIILFLVGEAINWLSDRKLIDLRKSKQGYSIPRGGWFEYVSCPNYLGEIVAWTGFAMAAQNLAALSFAVWTVANLLPRAMTHHRWYREQFADYPKTRKALIPHVL